MATAFDSFIAALTAETSPADADELYLRDDSGSASKRLTWAQLVAAIAAVNLTANTSNVTAAGALMDSEVTNLAAVKAFDASAYATAAQGTLADSALQLRTVNAQTGTTYTLVLADGEKIVTCNNAAAVTLTVPLNSSVAFPTGTEIPIHGIGAGIVTVAATGGVTVNGTPSLVFRDQDSAALLVKLGTDTWQLVGDLETP